MSIQLHLFPALEDEIGKLSKNEKKFVKIIELIDLHHYLKFFYWCGIGVSLTVVSSLAKAFATKAVWNACNQTIDLYYKLCVPNFWLL